MNGRILFLYLSLFAFVAPVFSRAGQQPAQTGRISGSVLDATTREPLKDARVILESMRRSDIRLEVTTGDNGSFLLDQLQPGSYLIHAERAGYITDHLPVGYARPVPLSMDVQAGRRYPVTLTLMRTASVSGRIYDVNRQPVAKAEIQILLPQ